MTKRIDGKTWLWYVRNKKNCRRGRPYWFKLNCSEMTTTKDVELSNDWHSLTSDSTFWKFQPGWMWVKMHPKAKATVIESQIETDEIELQSKKLVCLQQVKNLLCDNKLKEPF